MRKLGERSLATVADQAYVSLPSDYKAIEALYFDGDTRKGEINIVSADQLPKYKLDLGDSGVPMVGAVVNSRLYLAPVPDGAYTLYLKYEITLTPLSASATTNWLLDEHPDVYLYAVLAETEPYLQNDERIAVWKGQLEEALEKIAVYTERQQYTGRLVMRPRLALG